MDHNDEAASDPPTSPRSQSEHSSVQTGGDSMSTDKSSPSGSADVAQEGHMDTAVPAPKRPQQEPSEDLGESSAEPSSKHQRLIQSIQVDGDELYTLDEDWGDYPGDHDEHLEAQWDDSDDELDWSDLKESDGPPELSGEQLEAVDRAAEGDEVTRLVNMSVLKEITSQLEIDDAKLLRTRFVHDWRYREKAWKRRARLVCKQLRIWNPNRSDVYAPSTNPAVCRVIPLLFTSKPGWIMRAIDVKDAFLCVPQREELYVTLGGKTYQVLYCLPGQQAASAWWGEQLASDMMSAGLSVDVACPAVLGQESSGATVHVDDGLLRGLPHAVDAVVEVLEKKYKVQVSDPVSKPGDSLKFLKKDITVTKDGLVISLDDKYLSKLCELLNITNPRHRRVPCTQDILGRDESPELSAAQASVYRAAIGSLLYISPERPDAQFAIGALARCMSRPTKKAWSQLYMLGEYLWHTRHYELTLRWTFPGRSMLDERQLSAAEVAQKQVASANEPVLIEVLTDSDWAGAADRISTSSCHVFVNGNLAYAFVRKQGCVSLSSCEAELVSAVSGTAEGLYIAHVIRTAGACTTRIVLRLDSSSARSLLYKQGVSRVRHLATKLLWIQSFTKRKVIEPAAIPTVHNTSDLGTKPLTSKRIALLMRKIGYNSEYDNVQAVRSNAHVKALKKAVAAILVLTMTTEADALSPMQEFNFETNDFYILFFTSHPYTFIGFLIVLVIIVSLVMYRALASRTLVTTLDHHRELHGGQDAHGEPHAEPHAGPHEGPDAHGEPHPGPHEGPDAHGEPHPGPRGGPDAHGEPHGGQDAHGEPHAEPHGGPDHHRGPDRVPHAVDHRAVHPQVWPDLRFCPRAGTSYHRLGCGNLRSATVVQVYTRLQHAQNPLAQCQVCNPPLLQGSAPVSTRRRRRR